MKQVRTRFAPSPTGYLHIGGVRTALFNWLFARRHGGRFILRIDDTDRQRNVAETLQPILSGFAWLGLDWDEGPEVGGDHGPYFQSERTERYRLAVEKLLREDLAYHDFATTEELQAEREAAQKAKRRFVYSRKWRARTPEQRAEFESQGRKSVVRLAMPRDGACRFRDLVRGAMELEWAHEQDQVIQRHDGSFLYHLASVVDDHEMGITHVIRAEEHLSNTARQIFIATGLGYELPQYAHLPVVAEPGSRNKLSKRKLDRYLKNPGFAKLYAHGRAIAATSGLEVSDDTFNPVIVDFYRRVGYVPEALLNYLLLLGWSLDDKTELLDRKTMIEHFSLDRVNPAPASFDPQKLWSFQERYMQELSVQQKIDLALPFLERVGLVSSSRGLSPRIGQVVAAAGDRIKVAGDILEYAGFFVADEDLVYDSQAFEKRLREPSDAAGLLTAFRERLAQSKSFEAGALERVMQGFVESEGVKIGRIIHAVRVAVTGRSVGFGLFESLAILGREHCLARIDRALSLL